MEKGRLQANIVFMYTCMHVVLLYIGLGLATNSLPGAPANCTDCETGQLQQNTTSMPQDSSKLTVTLSDNIQNAADVVISSATRGKQTDLSENRVTDNMSSSGVTTVRSSTNFGDNYSSTGHHTSPESTTPSSPEKFDDGRGSSDGATRTSHATRPTASSAPSIAHHNYTTIADSIQTQTTGSPEKPSSYRPETVFSSDAPNATELPIDASSVDINSEGHEVVTMETFKTITTTTYESLSVINNVVVTTSVGTTHSISDTTDKSDVIANDTFPMDVSTQSSLNTERESTSGTVSLPDTNSTESGDTTLDRIDLTTETAEMTTRPEEITTAENTTYLSLSISSLSYDETTSSIADSISTGHDVTSDAVSSSDMSSTTRGDTTPQDILDPTRETRQEEISTVEHTTDSSSPISSTPTYDETTASRTDAYTPFESLAVSTSHDSTIQPTSDISSVAVTDISINTSLSLDRNHTTSTSIQDGTLESDSSSGSTHSVPEFTNIISITETPTTLNMTDVTPTSNDSTIHPTFDISSIAVTDISINTSISSDRNHVTEAPSTLNINVTATVWSNETTEESTDNTVLYSAATETVANIDNSTEASVITGGVSMVTSPVATNNTEETTSSTVVMETTAPDVTTETATEIVHPTSAVILNVSQTTIESVATPDTSEFESMQTTTQLQPLTETTFFENTMSTTMAEAINTTNELYVYTSMTEDLSVSTSSTSDFANETSSEAPQVVINGSAATTSSIPMTTGENETFSNPMFSSEMPSTEDEYKTQKVDTSSLTTSSYAIPETSATTNGEYTTHHVSGGFSPSATYSVTQSTAALGITEGIDSSVMPIHSTLQTTHTMSAVTTSITDSSTKDISSEPSNVMTSQTETDLGTTDSPTASVVSSESVQTTVRVSTPTSESTSVEYTTTQPTTASSQAPAFIDTSLEPVSPSSTSYNTQQKLTVQTTEGTYYSSASSRFPGSDKQTESTAEVTHKEATTLSYEEVTTASIGTSNTSIITEYLSTESTDYYTEEPHIADKTDKKTTIIIIVVVIAVLVIAFVFIAVLVWKSKRRETYSFMGTGVPDPKVYEASFGNPVYEMHPYSTTSCDGSPLPLKDKSPPAFLNPADVEAGLSSSHNGGTVH